MARYGFEHDKPERLAGFEATWDPGTRQLLGSLGVGPGWRCLEAGAGGGSIAAWLAARVGPGWLLVEDFDWALGGPADDAPAAARGYEAIIALLESIGYDPHYGRTLLRRLEDAGLEDTRSEARAYILRGGSPGTAFERLSILAHHEAWSDPVR
jgi:hypothetical protein